MIIKFNGGNGAILCEKCRRIIYTFSNMPQEFKDVQDSGGDLRLLPPIYCNKCKKDEGENI